MKTSQLLALCGIGDARMIREHWWKYTDRGKPPYFRRPKWKFIWTVLGLNPAICANSSMYITYPDSRVWICQRLQIQKIQLCKYARIVESFALLTLTVGNLCSFCD